MAPDWQVVSASLGPAPSWEGEQGGKMKGLMLRIEGVGVAGEEGEGGEEGLEALLGYYERRLGELKRVVEGGGGLGDGARAEEVGEMGS